MVPGKPGEAYNYWSGKSLVDPTFRGPARMDYLILLKGAQII